jgi:WD40 repeat protein
VLGLFDSLLLLHVGGAAVFSGPLGKGAARLRDHFAAASGEMLRVYRAALPADAAPNCAVFDGRRRKLIVGCNGGAVLCLNTFNCKAMKALPRHATDVSGLVYCSEDSTVVSGSWDGSLHVSDESLADGDGERQGLLRRVRRAHGRGVAVTALAFDHTLSLIASAGANLTVHVWDYQDATFLG